MKKMIRAEKLANQNIKKLKGKPARLTRDFTKEISNINLEVLCYEYES